MKLHIQSPSTAPYTESVFTSVSYFHLWYIVPFFFKKAASTVRVPCVKEKKKRVVCVKFSGIDQFYMACFVFIAQSCLPLCNPMNYSLPGSSAYGILQARILEWVTISFPRGFSQSKDQTRVSCVVGRFFTIWATREAPTIWLGGPYAFAFCLLYQKCLFP